MPKILCFLRGHITTKRILQIFFQFTRGDATELCSF
jgi:hypothetical protein